MSDGTYVHRVKFSEEVAVAIDTTYTGLVLDDASAVSTDPINEQPRKPLRQIYLGLVQLALTSIAGGAAEVTWFLSSDAAGDQPLTEEVVSPIVIGATTATSGGVADTVDEGILTDAAAIYVWAKLDAGTATVAFARAFWQV